MASTCAGSSRAAGEKASSEGRAEQVDGLSAFLNLAKGPSVARFIFRRS